ncbi:MAG: hypothetical protein J3R72DRAFT_463578 [Linnemannia gamsii]|nr:MAG: hypothetical protein J3R72DRAFT_463578 [Linnemannia gamsii]
MTSIRFVFTLCLMALLANTVLAGWCSCWDNPTSDECCSKIMNAGTFWSPLLGYGTCDVGGDSYKKDQFIYCCQYREGPGVRCS